MNTISKLEIRKEAIQKGAEQTKDLLSKLEKIESKEKCLRVKFLDWLSNKLLDWSNRTHVMSSNINSPCLIEVPLRTKKDSDHFKQSKEIARLKELLKEEREKNQEDKK